MVYLAMMDHQVSLVQREKPGHKVLMDKMAYLERQDCQELMDLMEATVHLDKMVCQAAQVLKEMPV